MLRVLHLIYDDPGNPWVAGGGAVRVFEIYRRLRGRLRSVTVATGAYPGARDEEIEGIRYLRIGARRPYPLSRATYSISAARLLRKTEYDVAVFDFSTYVPLSLPPDRPIGVTVHHITGGSAQVRWGRATGGVVAWQEWFRLRRARHFSATSLATLSRLREMVGPDVRIDRVGAGVPDSLFELARQDEGYLLYFGRLDWFQKGLDTLLDAAAILIRSRPGLRLKIAGRGQDAERVADYVRRLGIEANVDLLGPVDDAQRDALFAGAALALMPSRFEGFGMVAAEAMAAGIPLVASKVDSLPEVVDPPRGGVLVEPGQAADFASAAAHLLDHSEARKALSRSARESAERFRWERVANDHLAFLEAVQSEHRAQSERSRRH